jgi:hypothetical protein
MSVVKKWFAKASAPRRAPGVRPELEELEQRQVPTVTYHGGPLLQHVEVQALYYGSDWYYNHANYQTTGQLEGYLRYIVNSPYMDMLTNAGYSVGRGSFSQGRIDLVNINKSQYLNDSTIQRDLLGLIRNGTLQRNDANRLYIVFVEPGVAVRAGNEDSIHNFLGYHSAVGGVAYAVIPYHSGFNAHEPGVGTFDSITAVTSHELAEAVTDPLTNGRRGWFDDAYARTHGGEGEIGDIVNGQLVRLNGYAVQKEAGKNDQALSPAGSIPINNGVRGSSSSLGGFGFAAAGYGSAASLPPGWLAVLDVTLLPKMGAASGHNASDAMFATGGWINPGW